MTPKSSLALVAALLSAPSTAVEYTVETCADLADVDDTLVTGLIVDSSTFACDEYTRFRVRNTMTLKATAPAVKFSNFSLKVLGALTVEPDVAFTGVVEQVKNGGVLYIAEGAAATFLGTAEFTDNSIVLKQLGEVSCGDGCTVTGRGTSYIVKKGGAVHNKGTLSFEGDATFNRNEVRADDYDVGKAGAISNSGSGTILFNGNLNMANNTAGDLLAGLGGGMYNRGDISVDGDAYVSGGLASDGGGIYQTKIGKITFNGMATFVDNSAQNFFGGAVYNGGGIANFEAGSLFEGNFASGGGDGGLGGAIFNGDAGVITLKGSTIFRGNSAVWGGAIYNTAIGEWNSNADTPASITTFPDDTVFVDNDAENCPNVNNGYDRTLGGSSCPEV